MKSAVRKVTRLNYMFWAKENINNNVSVIVKTAIIGKEVIPVKFHLVKIQIHVKGEHLRPNSLVDKNT